MTRQFLALAVAAGFLAGVSTAAVAQSTPDKTPGHKMQEKGSVAGHAGASGYAPGIKMQEKGSVKGTTGASGYAPGHATTGSSIKGGADVNVNGSKAKTDLDAGGNVHVK
jgi:hypothetical protein